MKKIVLSAFLLLSIFSNEALAEPESRIIIDVRTESEWLGGHLQGASHIALSKIKNKIKVFEPNQDAEIMLYCRSGNRSGKAKTILEDMGYTNVKNIGGISSASTALNIKIIK
jgi:phage shock protein E